MNSEDALLIPAGVFKFIKDNFINSPSADLTSGVMDMLMAVMLVSHKHTFVLLYADSHSLMRSSRKYPYLPTPLEISIKFHMYISLNFLVLQTPTLQEIPIPSVGKGRGMGDGSMDIFLGQHNVTRGSYRGSH